jgi:cytochrome c556
MMMPSRTIVVALGLVAIVAIISQAQHAAAQGPLVEAVTERRMLMSEIQTAYWPLFELDAGKRTDFEVVGESVGQINSALDRFQALFPPGTARGETPGSRATPEIWSAPDEFNGAIKALKESLVELEAVAAEGDTARYKTKFAEVTTACVACHGFRPSSGGKFRFVWE